ncbi:hypothetical protein CALVIDRAFT_594494 [Calocera viscosa TUFC12733]|uniref:Uncharacterized protein n=1 Tax=Calocera viscosa (strain TUFC12733) TaxID=1330018 RepID=A0A167SDL4_CALVF|nr:hypothetical protein CALVIDRAFT_594494 [Calocera viscosa TUFC12733]
MNPLGRYLRLPTSSSSSNAAPDPEQLKREVDVEDDPAAVELHPLSWKAELSSSLDTPSLYARLILLLAPLLPAHSPSFSTLRRLLLLSGVLTLLLLSSVLYIHSSSLTRITAAPCPNAFRLPGSVHVNGSYAPDNYWVPEENASPDYPVHCPRDPPRLLEALQAYESSASSSDDETPELEHLRGRTVLLFGDSIDRLHLSHFCSFLGLDSRAIDASDALYPPELTELERQLAQDRGRPFESLRGRPFVCHAPRSDLLLLWVFYSGSDDGQSTPSPPSLFYTPAPPFEPAPGPWGPRAFWPQASEHFNPPLLAEDRFHQLALPLLQSLGRSHVDLVELGLGAWDLDLAKRLDHLSAVYVAEQRGQGEAEALKLTEEVIVQPLSQAFLDWARTRTEMLTRSVLHSLPQTTPVYLRPLGGTPQYYHWPYLISSARVEQMDALARQVVEQHRLERGTWMGRQRARVRMDNSGVWTRGEEHWEDHIHPSILPGSWVWGEWLLYALARSAQRESQ